MDVDFKDLASVVGAPAQVSDWLLVDQERVNKFAEATNDHQWIHVDVERATQAIGGTIVHGYLTLSLLPALGAGMLNVSGVGYVINYGSDKVRFVNMLRTGKRVRLSQTVLSVEPRGAAQMVRCECTIEIEGEAKPACVAETLTVIYGA
jgi:acyl dehydratase